MPQPDQPIVELIFVLFTAFEDTSSIL